MSFFQPNDPLLQKLSIDDQAKFLALQDQYERDGDMMPGYDQYTTLLSKVSGVDTNNPTDQALEWQTLNQQYTDGTLPGEQYNRWKELNNTYGQSSTPRLAGGPTQVPPPSAGTAPLAGGAGTGPTVAGNAMMAPSGLLSGAQVETPLSTMASTPAWDVASDVAISEATRAAMPGPEAFTGAAQSTSNLGQKLLGGLTSKAGVGLLMTGIGAALYMTSRGKEKKDGRVMFQSGQTPASPNLSTLNPYAAARAGSPEYGTVLPGNFRIQ